MTQGMEVDARLCANIRPGLLVVRVFTHSYPCQTFILGNHAENVRAIVRDGFKRYSFVATGVSSFYYVLWTVHRDILA